jgi:hypothetical protein
VKAGNCFIIGGKQRCDPHEDQEGAPSAKTSGEAIPWKDNGPSGIRVVTDQKEGSGQHFLDDHRKVKIREGKPVRITVTWHCGKFRWKFESRNA